MGVKWRAYGENIAAGQTTPEEVTRVWMNSPGHRANILDPRFTDIGVGYVAGTATSQYRTYWTQLFIQKP
ncbi:CAP domain-containing protein [Paenibacillus macquariensis]|uniref:CAP domain-containing protein n=1 Tax=Paenibacillus macquariensis TaxID=948756 RepID=UPI00313C6505